MHDGGGMVIGQEGAGGEGLDAGEGRAADEEAAIKHGENTKGCFGNVCAFLI